MQLQPYVMRQFWRLVPKIRCCVRGTYAPSISSGRIRDGSYHLYTTVRTTICQLKRSWNVNFRFFSYHTATILVDEGKGIHKRTFQDDLYHSAATGSVSL